MDSSSIVSYQTLSHFFQKTSSSLRMAALHEGTRDPDFSRGFIRQHVQNSGRVVLIIVGDECDSTSSLRKTGLRYETTAAKTTNKVVVATEPSDDKSDSVLNVISIGDSRTSADGLGRNELGVNIGHILKNNRRKKQHTQTENQCLKQREGKWHHGRICRQLLRRFARQNYTNKMTKLSTLLQRRRFIYLEQLI